MLTEVTRRRCRRGLDRNGESAVRGDGEGGRVAVPDDPLHKPRREQHEGEQRGTASPMLSTRESLAHRRRRIDGEGRKSPEHELAATPS